jgi:hypothetical protein
MISKIRRYSMSETSSKQPDKAPATPGIESPEQSDELGAEELDKVAGGMKPNVVAPRKPVRLTGDPCEGGE